VQAAASFYVPDTYADRTPPETGLATADAEAPQRGSDGLSGFLERMQALGYADEATGSSR
jgi:hypothetical protein